MGSIGPFVRRLDELAAMNFAEIQSYWRDPAPLNAEIEANRAEVHAAIDRGMAPLNDKQAARWADDARTNGGQSNG